MPEYTAGLLHMGLAGFMHVWWCMIRSVHGVAYLQSGCVQAAYVLFVTLYRSVALKELDNGKKRASKKECSSSAFARARERSSADTQAVDEKSSASSRLAASVSRSHSKKEVKKRGRFIGYLADVKSEMHRVVWPTKAELKNYSIATVAALIVCGIATWLIDTGFISLLITYTNLRG